jgi:membrane protein implicated in regulation of membrane protease activity
MLKWAFDGVGGALLVALLAVASRRFFSRKNKKDKPASSEVVGSVAAGVQSQATSIRVGSSHTASPIVVGSHNTITIPPPEMAPRQEQEAESLRETLIGVGIFLIVAAALAGVIFFIVTGRADLLVTRITGGPLPNFEVGIAFADDIPVQNFSLSESDSCVTNNVTCLGEAAIRNGPIPIGLPAGSKWARVAVLVTNSNVSSSIENPHVVVSTTSTDVGLEYAGHRDGVAHRQLEFTPFSLSATSESGHPDAFSVDISPPQGGREFPLAVTVWGDGVPKHTLTMQLRFISTPVAHAPSNSSKAKAPAGDAKTSDAYDQAVEIGVAVGKGIPAQGFDLFESESCVTSGIRCLAEGEIAGKTVEIPVKLDSGWARIAFLVTTHNLSGYIEEPHVAVSTSSIEDGMNYPDQRDGSRHSRLVFTPEIWQATSQVGRPESVSIDLYFGSPSDEIPLDIAVWGVGLPKHSISTKLRLASSLGPGGGAS